jgi:hypothetical protein
MEWLPTAKADVEKFAKLLFRFVPVPSAVAPSKNVTVPLAAENTMKALNVTACPANDGLGLEVSVVPVGCFTVCTRDAVLPL